MVVAGIDEAGYGPLLGPLVVGCCAFEVQVDPPPAPGEVPCLWKRLRKHVSKTRAKDDRKLHVNDSKAVYSPATGLKELERSILALLAASGKWPADLHGLLSRVADHIVADLAGYPWYQPPAGEAFPLEQDALPVQLFAKGLRGEMERTDTRLLHLSARVVCERQFNRMCNATRNKASTLFSVAAVHLDYLLRTFGGRDLVIVCDRQGGRGHYGHLLRLMFEEWSLEIVSETDARSEYVLRRDDVSSSSRPAAEGETSAAAARHAVRLIFAEKAEAQCLPVAVASMLSKYLREALMRRFNAWWRQHIPDLAPTAGYYGDGVRFLHDIDAKRRELAIADEDLIRSR